MIMTRSEAANGYNVYACRLPILARWLRQQDMNPRDDR